jgi:hypothetical protein
MVVGLPELTAQDRAAASAAALAARRRRAAVKEGLAAGDVSIADVLALADDDKSLAKMRVLDLLEAVPRIGPVRAQAIMEQLDIAATRRLRGLGERQRRGLTEFFERM